MFAENDGKTTFKDGDLDWSAEGRIDPDDKERKMYFVWVGTCKREPQIEFNVSDLPDHVKIRTYSMPYDEGHGIYFTGFASIEEAIQFVQKCTGAKAYPYEDWYVRNKDNKHFCVTWYQD